jgi:hypothetical protein
MRSNLVVVLTGLAFLLIGIGCVFWPERIQELSLRYYAAHERVAKLNPFLEWMQSRSYVVVLRIIGIASIGVFLVAMFVAIRR